MSARNTFAASRRSHQILGWLKKGEKVTIERVCETFGVKYPQAREDIKLLEEIYGLASYRDGRTKVWTLESQAQLPVVTVAAAAALEFGGIALDIFDGTPYASEIKRVAEEFRQRVPIAQRERMERLSQALHLRRTWLPANPEAMNERVEDILDAIFLNRDIRLAYERSDGAGGTYVLTPHKIVWYNGRLWLLARHEGTVKLFDVAAIRSLKRLSASSSPVAQGEGDNAHQEPSMQALQDAMESVDPAAHFATAFGIFAGNFPVQAVHLVVRNSWANYLRRYRVHPSQAIEEARNGLHVRLEVGICPEFITFVMGMLPDVDIISPESLREEVSQRVERWRAANPSRQPA